MGRKPIAIKTKKKIIKLDNLLPSTFETLQKIEKADIKGNALDIFKRRFALKDEKGIPRETVEEAIYRVASHVAEGEPTQKLKDAYTQNYFNLIADKRFVPNTPTWSGAKTRLGQLAACFVLPISDDMGKDSDGIFQTLRNAALIQQTGGGNGFSFSNLRPMGDLVKASNGVASGPVSFLKAYDAAFGNIAQGGTRRGANMAVLRVDHPDIESFIRCKSSEGSISNFNISVGITDEFMKCVKEDRQFDLINPRTKEVWKTVSAKALFNEIVEYATKNGEPGILFLDTANRDNPVPAQYVLEATNPCGEQWLGPYENCCLGHVNINASVKNNKIDWAHLKESVILGTRFLDDVVTMNSYVPSVPQLKEAAHKNRRIGLGYLGLADAMYQLNIRYGSPESVEFTSQITEFVRYYSMLTSIDLAREREPFPGIKGSIYDKNNLKWKKPTPLYEYSRNFERPNIDWEYIEKNIRKYGIRNSTQLTVAPTGTTSTVFDAEGYGCEPVFALAYYRNVYQAAGGDKNLTLTYVSPSFNKALNESDLSESDKQKIIDHSINKGSIQDLEIVPEKIKNTFVVSADIKPEEHVVLQAAIQRFVDNSISKTCNFPKDATQEDIAKAYVMAWDLGCKGLTVYVTGSREEVVLETKETKNSKENKNEVVYTPGERRERPVVVYGRTHRIQTPFGKAYVTVNRDGESGISPFEVFVNLGKSGSDTSAMSEALGRLISGWLRSSPDPESSLKDIVVELKGIGGSSTVGFGPNRVSSIPDAVGKVLQKEVSLATDANYKKQEEYSSNNTSISVTDSSIEDQKEVPHTLHNASVCPDCGNMSLIETEGCVKCVGCGYSRC